jgi:hypothetical protein
LIRPATTETVKAKKPSAKCWNNSLLTNTNSVEAMSAFCFFFVHFPHIVCLSPLPFLICLS